jgi:hypothetical protein
MTIGIKVVKEGKDISSTNPDDYILNSEYGTVKIYKQNDNKTYDIATVPASSYVDITITHSLGFPPMTMLYMETTPGSGNWFFGLPYEPSENTYVDSDTTYTYVDDTYFKFRIVNRTSSQKIIKYYYFILGNTVL